MSEDYWKEVERGNYRSLHGTYTMSTYEHTMPNGVLVLVVTDLGDTKNTSMQFVPNPTNTQGPYR